MKHSDSLIKALSANHTLKENVLTAAKISGQWFEVKLKSGSKFVCRFGVHKYIRGANKIRSRSGKVSVYAIERDTAGRFSGEGFYTNIDLKNIQQIDIGGRNYQF